VQGASLATIAALVWSVNRDRLLLGGRRRVLMVVALWIVAGIMGQAALANLSDFGPNTAAWLWIGAVWLALACTGGRIVLMMDRLFEDSEGNSTLPVHLSKRVRRSQIAFVMIAVVAAAAVAFIAVAISAPSP